MGLRDVNLGETALGFEIRTPFGLFFFGKKDAARENLAAAYPFAWARVRQTHSDIVVHSPGAAGETPVEADAHWTKTGDLALLISTADCVPVLLADPEAGIVAAIHAGWRGVASRIVSKTLAEIFRQGARPERTFAFVGPHIQMASFEVGDDVRDLLLNASPEEPALITRPSPDGKTLVDLHAIVKAQLAEAGLRDDAVAALHLDTFVDRRLHSHRRDREKAGRQLSFAVLTP